MACRRDIFEKLFFSLNLQNTLITIKKLEVVLFDLILKKKEIIYLNDQGELLKSSFGRILKIEEL